MRRLVLLATVVAGLTVAATAQAKGPITATIDGPGIDGGISVGGDGAGSAALLWNLTSRTGFFAAAFGRTPDPMLDGRPQGGLGPRYTMTYRLPAPNNREDLIRQDLYPYAAGGPVTYTAPGQSLFGTQSTRGGWYRASPSLKRMLIRAGLPDRAPSQSSGNKGGPGFADFWPAYTVLFVLGLVALTAIVIRRRPRTVTT